MSLVGTRPPTVDEWEKYELHHRARLAAKPGLRQSNIFFDISYGYRIGSIVVEKRRKLI